MSLKDRTILELKDESDDRIKSIFSCFLEKAGYKITDQNYSMMCRPRVIAACVDTDKGKKFVKLHNKDAGYQEYKGCVDISKYLPTIKSECLIRSDNLELVVQPYIEGIDVDKGMLFDVIGKLESNQDADSEKYWSLFDRIYQGMYQSVSKTMNFSLGKAENDRLFADRLKTQKQDNQMGNLERFYSNSTITLGDKTYDWPDFVNKKWKIDGVEYKETLGELLEKAKGILDPKQQRLLGFSQGDWHEMNIFTDILDEKVLNPTFAYLDFEMAGNNDLIGDAMVYLIYTCIYGDYVGPKNFPNDFFKSKQAVVAAQKNIPQKQIQPEIEEKEGQLCLNKIGRFGTSEVRKTIAKKFLSLYLRPMIKLADQKFGQSFAEKMDEKIKSCLLLRILGPCNVSKMDPMDQAKLFSLVFKLVGTPKDIKSEADILDRFFEAL